MGETRDVIGMGARRTEWKRAFVVASVGLFGCGGGTDGGRGEPPMSCLQVQPCGGDVVGTWRFVGGCAAEASVFTALAQTSCPGTEVSQVAFGASGSVTFNADLTYVGQGWNTTYSDTVTRPLSCSSGAASCDALDLSVTATGGSFLTEDCSGATTCACHSSSRNAMTESGTYTVTGTKLDLTAPSTTRSRSFCVEGSRLHIIEFSATATDVNGLPLLLADSVAERL
jgi:hypothetical protein